MKKLISLLLAAAMLLSLGAAALAEEADPMAIYRTGSPWACVDLEGVATADMPVDARDNFAFYVNHDFYLNTVIDSDRLAVGTMRDLSQVLEEDLAALISGESAAEGEDLQMIRGLYTMLLDWDSRNEQGMTPVMGQVEALEAVSSIDELNDYLLTTDVLDSFGGIFTLGVMQDLIDPDRYVAGTTTSGILLSDAAEYSERTPLGQARYESCVMLLTGLLQKVGYTEEQVQQKIENAFAWEAMMAPLMYTNEDMSRPDYIARILNYVTREEMLVLEGSLPIVEMEEQVLQMGTWDTWLVMNPAFLEGIQELYVDENVELITDWMICMGLRSAAGSLDQECYDLSNAAAAMLTGTEPVPDEKYAMSQVQAMLPWEVARLYCESYFTQADKDEMETIIQGLVEGYQAILSNTAFLSEETRQAAIEKLGSLRVRALFPDDWSEYVHQDLVFDGPEAGGTLWAAMRAISAAGLAREREELTRPIDHERWDMVPTTVNCFYDPSSNSVNILAAFCRGDMYSSDMPLEEKYGKIGFVVGHEISHAFDSSGAQYDSTGAFADWWAAEDKAEFGSRVARLESYMNGIELWEGEAVHGSIKTGEAGADMAAMQCMLSMAAQIPDFDYDLFFRSFARAFCSLNRFYLVQILQTDTHPEDYTRINMTLQQFDKFFETYGITEGDNMYLAPEDRVLIWQ